MKKKIIFALLSIFVLNSVTSCNGSNNLKDSFDTFEPFEFRFKNSYFDDGDNTTISYSDNAMFQMDYKPFVDSSVSIYNKNLAKLALLLSCNLYPWTSYEFYRLGSYNESTFIEKINAKDITLKQLNASDYNEDKDDLTSFELAHYEFDYKNEHQQIFFITYQGTDQDVEWSSNFDVGADLPQYYEDSLHTDWVIKNNHKGFEVAANRSYQYIDEYILSHQLEDHNTILFISGHSRGAGIANIAGYHYSRIPSFKTFCYTFGATATTITSNAVCGSVHNIINKEDIIANIIPSNVGFKRYGYDYIYSGLDYLFNYENFVNHRYMNLDMDLVIEELAKYMPNREAIYKIPQDYVDNLAKMSGFNSRDLAELSRNALFGTVGLLDYEKYIEVSEIYQNGEEGWEFKWKASPSLMLKGFGQYMSDKNLLDVAYLPIIFPSFANVLFPKLPELVTGIEPIAYPHMPECYWIILNSK